MKNLSIITLISLVSLISGLLGFIIGFLIKQPAVNLADSFVEEKLRKPMMHIIEYKESNHSSEMFFNFKITSGFLDAIESEPNDIELPKKLLSYHLKYQLPKFEEYCNNLYPESRAYSECTEVVNKAKKQIKEIKPHNQQLKRTP